MSMFRLVEGGRDTGMMVVGSDIEYGFTQDADSATHPDGKLEIIPDIEELKSKDAMREAALGYIATHKS